jgi:hypothetical protein
MGVVEGLHEAVCGLFWGRLANCVYRSIFQICVKGDCGVVGYSGGKSSLWV